MVVKIKKKSKSNVKKRHLMHRNINSDSDNDDTVIVEWFPCTVIDCESKC